MKEIWKDVPQYEGYYMVSNRGRVKSVRYNKLLNACNNKEGYPTVLLQVECKCKSFHVHQLVLKAFIGERPQGKETRHLNGIKTNNRLENLTYGTPRENHEDRVRHGTVNWGMRNGRAKITDRDVISIRQSTKKARELANRFNLSINQIKRIKSRESWSHL